ncbi:MAG: hypothetical protein NVSMB51_06080 [Solirubrobacteraceae bacterium]
MSTPGLFLVGVLVTLIVAAALALLFYAAVLDGRYAADQRLIRERQLPSEDQRTVPEADRGPMVAA